MPRIAFGSRPAANQLRTELARYLAPGDDRRSKTIELQRGTPQHLIQRAERAAADSRQEETTTAAIHSRLEDELIRQFGGTPKDQYGPDGVIGGDPVEVRVAGKEERFRVNQDTHQELLANDGSYIFDDRQDSQPPREVSAEVVDGRLDDDWYSDRGYMHQFLSVEELTERRGGFF